MTEGVSKNQVEEMQKQAQLVSQPQIEEMQYQLKLAFVTLKYSTRKSNDVINGGVERELAREINTLNNLLDDAYQLKTDLLRLKVEAGTDSTAIEDWSDDVDATAEGFEDIVKEMRRRLHKVQEEERGKEFQRNME